MKKTQKIRLIASIALIAFVAGLHATLGETIGLVENTANAFWGVVSILFVIGFVKGLYNIKTTSGLAYIDGLVISDTTYAGEVASQFIVKAITGADMIGGGNMYVKDGIKKKFTIPRWDADYEDLIQDRAATPVSKGGFTVDGRVLEPADYMIYTEFNPRNFEDHWFATQLSPNLIDRALPYTAESVTVQEVLKRHTKWLNKIITIGDTALSAPSIYRYFNGLVTKMLADTSVVDVGSYAALDSSNIVPKFKAGYDKLPDALKYDPNMKVYCNYKTFNYYDEAQKNQTYKGVDFTKVGQDEFYGRKVVRVADMPDNCFFYAKGMATTESNLWLGINSTEDASIQLSRLQANSEMWFIKMLMKADVNYGFGEEIVLYHPNM